MTMLRKALAIVVSATLVWVGVATGLLSAPSVSMTGPTAPVSGHVHADHAHSDHARHTHGHADLSDTQNNKRACAQSCLDLVAAKLVPAAAPLDPPHLVALPVSGDDESGFQQSSKAPRAYWPAAPPDRSAAGLTGAARTLAYHSHLRI